MTPEEINQILQSLGGFTSNLIGSLSDNANLIEKYNLEEKKAILDSEILTRRNTLNQQFGNAKSNYESGIQRTLDVIDEANEWNINSSELNKITSEFTTDTAKELNEELGIELQSDLTYNWTATDNAGENLKRMNAAIAANEKISSHVQGQIDEISALGEFIKPEVIGTSIEQTDGDFIYPDMSQGSPFILDRPDLAAWASKNPVYPVGHDKAGKAIFPADKPWILDSFLEKETTDQSGLTRGFVPEYNAEELQNLGLARSGVTGRVGPALTKSEVDFNTSIQQTYPRLEITLEDKINILSENPDANILQERVNLVKQLNEEAMLDAEEEQIGKLGMGILKADETKITHLIQTYGGIDDIDLGDNILDGLVKIDDINFGENVLSKDLTNTDDYINAKVNRSIILKTSLDQVLDNVDNLLKYTIDEDAINSDAINYLQSVNTSFGKGKFDAGNTAGLDYLIGGKGQPGMSVIIDGQDRSLLVENMDGSWDVDIEVYDKIFEGNLFFGDDKDELFKRKFIGNLVIAKELQSMLEIDNFSYGVGLDRETVSKIVTLQVGVSKGDIPEEEFEERYESILKNAGLTSKGLKPKTTKERNEEEEENLMDVQKVLDDMLNPQNNPFLM